MSFTDDGSPVAGCQSLRLPTVAPLQVSCTETYASTTTQTIVASYGGDEDDAGSSASLVQAVGQVPTRTTVTSSSATPTYGQDVTLTATVTPTPNATASPTGTVTFYDFERERSGEPHGIGTVDDYETRDRHRERRTAGATTATLDISSLMGGPHAITASYNGDPNFGPSAPSGPGHARRGRGTDDGDLASSGDESVVGQTVVFTVTIGSRPRVRPGPSSSPTTG